MMFTLKRHKTTTTISFSCSKTNISDLDYDILVEIIMRLEIKHMVSCKCVSKLWHQLISTICIPRITSPSVYGLLFNTCPFSNITTETKTDQFCPFSNITTETKTDQFLGGPWHFSSLINDEKLTSSSPLPIFPSVIDSFLARILPFPLSPMSLLDCCNGLLLFFHISSMIYFVCNPSTQQFNIIPNSPRNAIAYDGALIFYQQHYKVIQITRFPPRIFIFCLTTRRWSGYCFDLGSCVYTTWSPRYIFLDASLYKLSMSLHLMKFTFGVETIGFKTIQLPKDVNTRYPIGCLGLSQGNLHYSWGYGSSKIKVWMLTRTDKWVFKHTVSLEYYVNQPVLDTIRDVSGFSVFAFHPTSNILFIGNSTEIFCYDPDTKRMDKICGLKKDEISQYLVFPFSVNLTSLCASGQNTTKQSVKNRLEQ